jgi:hypothetical protein
VRACVVTEVGAAVAHDRTHIAAVHRLTHTHVIGATLSSLFCVVVVVVVVFCCFGKHECIIAMLFFFREDVVNEYVNEQSSDTLTMPMIICFVDFTSP